MVMSIMKGREKFMKTMFTLLLLLILMGCASTESSQKMDPELQFGGSFRTRAMSSHGM